MDIEITYVLAEIKYTNTHSVHQKVCEGLQSIQDSLVANHS